MKLPRRLPLVDPWRARGKSSAIVLLIVCVSVLAALVALVTVAFWPRSSPLAKLGMASETVEQVRGLSKQRSGLIIVCGVEDAGASETIYATIGEIAPRAHGIIEIPASNMRTPKNVTQIEVKSQETVADALRAVQMQHTDVVVIREMPNLETLRVACETARGRFVLAALRANDTRSALLRMLELGIEPTLLSHSLAAVIDQGQVRALCEHCREPYKPMPEHLQMLKLPASQLFYRAPRDPQSVCRTCDGTGYSGRIGVFEVLVVNDAIRKLIVKPHSITDIQNEARKAGMVYLQEDGVRKIARGITSFTELSRVIKSDLEH